jgi:nucleoid DNA-binding protein
MDIDLLSKMVKELILDNDRVVLPGLGSFVAEVVPSTFSDKGYTINPPYRRLYFRSKPDEGSELAEFYAATNKVEKDVAERIIIDFVKELRSILHTKKTVVFPGLGRLRATRENNAFFVADEDLDIYPAGFGLEPISLKTHQETREEVSAALVGLKSILEETVPEMPVADIPVQETPVQEEPVPEESAPEEAVPEETLPELPAAEETVPEKPAPEVVEEKVVETPAAEQRKKRGFLKTLLIVAAVLLVLLTIYAVVGRIFPELVDRFLYTPEELNILNRKL